MFSTICTGGVTKALWSTDITCTSAQGERTNVQVCDCRADFVAHGDQDLPGDGVHEYVVTRKKKVKSTCGSANNGPPWPCSTQQFPADQYDEAVHIRLCIGQRAANLVQRRS